MTNEACHGLLVHTTVQKRCHEIMTQSVEVVLFWKVDGFINLSQAFGEGIWMNEPSVFISKEVWT